MIDTMARVRMQTIQDSRLYYKKHSPGWFVVRGVSKISSQALLSLLIFTFDNVVESLYDFHCYLFLEHLCVGQYGRSVFVAGAVVEVAFPSSCNIICNFIKYSRCASIYHQRSFGFLLKIYGQTVVSEATIVKIFERSKQAF